MQSVVVSLSIKTSEGILVEINLTKNVQSLFNVLVD